MKPEPNRTPEGESLVPLIERAKAGDQRAYTALYEATEREVYRTVRAMIRSEELARDVQQEVYVYAFTHLDSLREPEKLRAWLRSIAVNQSHMALRQVSPVLFTELDNGEGAELPELADLSGDTEPELTLERKETARYVSEILDDLTDGQRAVVAMYYYEQLPVSEIARDLGVTPGTVKTQLFRSRKKIETAVRRLEDRGVKLLGLAPLPFLVALLKRLPPAAEGSKAALQGALARSGLTPAAQAAGTVTAGTASTAGTAASVAGTAAADAAASFAETAAVQVGRRFFETALGKVVLGLITAAAIGGGIAGFKWYQNQFNVGDVRPPETLEINLHCDTNEDLTNEPTAETDTEPVTTAAPETNEDLVPETDEDLPPEPTDSVETTDPVGAGDQTSPSSGPTTPPETASISEESSEVPVFVPDEPAGPPRIVSCKWGYGDSTELYDLPWGFTTRVEVVTENDAMPVVTTDNPAAIRLWYECEFHGGDLEEGQKGYFWLMEILQSGVAHVFCSLDDTVIQTLIVNTPEYPEKLLEASLDIWPDNNGRIGLPFSTPPEACYTDSWLRFSCLIQGRGVPELTTDNPAVVSLDLMQTATGGEHWSQQIYFMDCRIIGPGDAELYLTVNGVRERVWTIHASVWEEPDPTEP